MLHHSLRKELSKTIRASCPIQPCLHILSSIPPVIPSKGVPRKTKISQTAVGQAISKALHLGGTPQISSPLFLLSRNFIEVTCAKPREVILTTKVAESIPRLLSQISSRFTIDSSESKLSTTHLDRRIDVVLAPRANRDLYSVPPQQSKASTLPSAINRDPLTEAQTPF
jgi:hypothetical protein